MADARVFSLMREWLGMQAADTLPLMESFQTTTEEAVV